MSRRGRDCVLAWAILASMTTCERRTPSATTPPDAPATSVVALYGPRPKAAPPPVSDADEAVQRWVAEHAIPLKTVEAGNGFDDMQPLRAVVGDARVVALGEATHGTREFFQLKHRMLEFLVTEMGFTVFAIEATMPEAFDVNEYVLHGVGDPRKVLSGLYFWTWDTEEVLAMIEWMRAYNADPRHVDKVKFYGFDMQFGARAVETTVEYLARVDPREARKAERALAILMDPFMMSTQRDWTLAQRRRVLNGARALVRHLEHRRAAYSSRTGTDAYELALQHARIVEQCVDVRVDLVGAPRPYSTTRDQSMARNVEWILAREPGKKVVLWAHNLHVATAGDFLMGTELRRALGSAMVVFGFAFYRGGFRAVDGAHPGWRLADFVVGRAAADGLDSLLASAGKSLFALDLRTLPSTGPVAEWFDAPHEARTIGAVYSSKHAGYRDRELTKARYDALLFVDRTTAARGTPTGRDRGATVLEAPANLGFEAVDAQGLPPDWEVASQLDAFSVELESSELDPAEGRRFATLRKSRTNHHVSDWYADVSQTLDPASYGGKRVRLRASVRADARGPREHAYLWLRVRRPLQNLSFNSGIASRAIVAPRWVREEIEIVVPADAVSLSYGLALVGEGEASIDGVELTVIGP
jgi:erythromycin esterase